jgi:hypothetical protein
MVGFIPRILSCFRLGWTKARANILHAELISTNLLVGYRKKEVRGNPVGR